MVWLFGAVVLCLKGGSLVLEAHQLYPEQKLQYIMVMGAIVLGLIKTRYLFDRSCLKNLIRIEALEHPKIWQFFKPIFFLFMVCMVVFGMWLSNIAHGKYYALLMVGGVDLSIAVALLGSSRHFFWRAISRS